jgi:hypothetical protein
MRFQRFSPVIRYLEEPLIEVGSDQGMPEPKFGWSFFGPLGNASNKYNINVGLIGDKDSLEKTKNLIEKLKIATPGKDQTFLHVGFPGIEKIRINIEVKGTAEIDSLAIQQLLENSVSLSDRIELVSTIIREKIKKLVDKEPTPDVLILAYPQIIDYYCLELAKGHRGQTRLTPAEKRTLERKSSNLSLDKFLGTTPPPEIFRSTDLRSVIKAQCMEYNIPIQIIRPYTFEPYNREKSNREDDATVFWNLIVALFYKSNKLPWRVKGLVEDSCYMGISFFRDRNDPSTVKTALSHVFSVDSEGYVFKGSKAFTDENRTLHLTKDDAYKLSKQAVEQYKTDKGHSPRRIVIHKTSKFNELEREGFKAGAKGTDVIDLIAFGTRSIKLLRWGKQPPMRGTMVRLPDNSVLLYTFGCIPFYRVYPGPRVPSPLEILEHHGPTDIETVCKEILALTKLNWNYAKFCIKSPITVSFSKRVGQILRESSIPEEYIKTKFKFYM